MDFIQIELHATLKRHMPESGRVPMRAGMRVRELIRELGIPEYEVNLVFVNGARGNLDAPLAGGDRLSLFPPLGGG